MEENTLVGGASTYNVNFKVKFLQNRLTSTLQTEVLTSDFRCLFQSPIHNVVHHACTAQKIIQALIFHFLDEAVDSHTHNHQ